MAADAIAEIKARLDIVDTVGAYVRLQRSGREHKGLCPFHSEKTPSFTVSQERQAWYCFGCQEGGDLLRFVQKVEHLEFMQALEMLAEKAGVELTSLSQGGDRRDAARRRARALELHRRAQAYYEHVLWETEAGGAGRALLTERAVSEEQARRFGVGFAPSGGVSADALVRYLVARRLATAAEVADVGLAHGGDRGGPARDRFRHRLVLPIRDERGACVGFGARAVADQVPKYLNSPTGTIYNKSTALFGIDLARAAIVETGTAVVVEGYFDVIAAHTAGVRNAVAASGTALTREHAHGLRRLANTVVLCFDGDDAGVAATTRAVDVIAAEGLTGRIAVLPGDAKDPDDLVRRDPVAFVSIVSAARPEWQVLLDRALVDAEGGSVEARRAGSQRAIALLTRIPVAATRDLYTQQAARRLDLDVQSLRADVQRAVSGGGRGPTRVVAVAPSPPPAPAGVAGGVPGHPLAPWEAYLGSLIVQRPRLARSLSEQCGLQADEVRHPQLRLIFEAALEMPDAAVLPLHRLGAAEQAVAARLLLRSLPELQDPDDAVTVSRVLADCVCRLREATLQQGMEAVRRRLRLARDGGRVDEAAGLSEELHALAAEAHRLREAALPL